MECYVDEAIATSKTDVIISFPKITTIKFNQKIYTALYQIDGGIPKINMTNCITVEESPSNAIIAVGEYSFWWNHTIKQQLWYNNQ